jgi:sugar lactone lactonase YvrE
MLAACGGGGGDSTTAVRYAIGGTVTGLQAAGLVLQNNGGDDLALQADASGFTFAATLAEGASYSVSVKTQPNGQWCTVARGQGTMAGSAVTTVAVACVKASAHVGTLVGSGATGSNDGTGTAAAFNQPSGVAVDASGRILVADTDNNTIRSITAAGVVTTLAGSPDAIADDPAQDGKGSAASFYWPQGLATDAAGNLYVADTGHNLIRKVAPDGTVSTLAGAGIAGWDDGPGVEASFNQPQGVAVDAAGNVYVADTGNDAIRKITPQGVVSTLAGAPTSGWADGVGTAAAFRQPAGLAIDAAGQLYVADSGNHVVRKISPAGSVSTLAGSGAAGAVDGSGTAAAFNAPMGVAVDAQGTVYVADFGNQRIRRITSGGVVSTWAGSGVAADVDGIGTAAAFNGPIGVAIDAAGNLYVAEAGGHVVRKIVSGP